MKNLYLLLLFSITIHAQDFEWVQTPSITLSSNPDLVGYVTACDLSGHVYLAGFKDTATPYNDIFGTVFFNKYNDAGALQFSNTFGGKVAVYDIAADTSGNVILALGYLDSITIGATTLTSTALGINPLVAKFDTDGNLLWYYQPAINGSPAGYFKAVITDGTGNVYLGYDNFNASYIEKLNPDGQSQMLITQSHVSLLSSLDTDTEGNIYAAGSCVDIGSTFGGTAVSTSLTYNTYVVKYSPMGIYQWVRFVDDITCAKPEVSANTPDEVYFTSMLPGAYTFDGIATEGPVSGMFSDFFLTRLNASGTFQWVREVPGAGQAYGGKRNYLTCDASGNVYFSGFTRWAIDWGNGITTDTGGFASDAMLLKYNASGNLTMLKTAGGTLEDRFDGIAVNSLGDIYLSGMARGNTTFGPLQHTSDGTTPYPFLTKINNSALTTHEAQANNLLRIAPNPVKDYFCISSKQKIRGSIYNVLGQDVMDFETDGNAPVNTSKLNRGIYTVKADGVTVKISKE